MTNTTEKFKMGIKISLLIPLSLGIVAGCSTENGKERNIQNIQPRSMITPAVYRESITLQRSNQDYLPLPDATSVTPSPIDSTQENKNSGDYWI